MGKCYDTLYEKAKNTKIKRTVPAPDEDVEYNSKVNSEKAKYKQIAEDIRTEEEEKIDKAHKAKMDEIGRSKQLLINRYKEERFNSKDTKKFGDSGIKTTYAKEMNKLSNGDGYNDSISKKQEEERKQDNKEKENKDKIDINKKENKAKENLNKKSDNENCHDLLEYASSLGHCTDSRITSYENNLKEIEEQYKKDIDRDAMYEGYNEGAKMVQEYNQKIAETAKDDYNTNKMNIAKAEIKEKTSVQSALMKLFAMVGT